MAHREKVDSGGKAGPRARGKVVNAIRSCNTVTR
jgi:hypothetical protein